MTNFQTRRLSDGETARLVLSGELDVGSADALEQQVRGIEDRTVRELVIDLRELDFIDSSGLRAILHIDALGESRGWTLKLIPGSEDVQRVFELTGTAERLPFARDAG
jgi:anti-anti-sigma factor